MAESVVEMRRRLASLRRDKTRLMEELDVLGRRAGAEASKATAQIALDLIPIVLEIGKIEKTLKDLDKRR